MDEIARDVHFYFRGSHPHFEKKLIQVDVLWTHGVGGSVVANEVEFDLDDSEHGRFKHVFEEDPLLGVDHLVIAILESFVALDVFDVQMGVKSEPLLVLPLVG